MDIAKHKLNHLLPSHILKFHLYPTFLPRKDPRWLIPFSSSPFYTHYHFVRSVWPRVCEYYKVIQQASKAEWVFETGSPRTWSESLSCYLDFNISENGSKGINIKMAALHQKKKKLRRMTIHTLNIWVTLWSISNWGRFVRVIIKTCDVWKIS